MKVCKHVTLVLNYRCRSPCTFRTLLGLLCFWCPSRPKLANDGIRSILGDDIRRMDHVELFSSILACKSENGKLTAWVIGKEAGYVEHLASHYNPTITLRRVLRNPCQ